MAALPSGSYLVMADAASDIAAEASAEAARIYNAMASATITMRTGEQVARFFARLELVPPGMVPMSQWGLPDPVAICGYNRIKKFLRTYFFLTKPRPPAIPCRPLLLIRLLLSCSTSAGCQFQSLPRVCGYPRMGAVVAGWLRGETAVLAVFCVCASD
jgi:hypothetical protein